jgi:PIN domain nuclease of toxin-antitoxin system
MAIYLDTHVVIWLYAGETAKLSQTATELINTNELLISPIVLLEMNYLYEIGRVSQPAEAVFSDLSHLDLKVCEKSFKEVVRQALNCNWTRDPFDRLIVGHASIGGDLLLTKDETIRTITLKQVGKSLEATPGVSAFGFRHSGFFRHWVFGYFVISPGYFVIRHFFTP